MMCQRERMKRMSKQTNDILKRKKGPYVIRNQWVTRCMDRLALITGHYCDANYDPKTSKFNDEI